MYNTKKCRVPPERCGGGIDTERRCRVPGNQSKSKRQSIPMSGTASLLVRLPRLPDVYTNDDDNNNISIRFLIIMPRLRWPASRTCKNAAATG